MKVRTVLLILTLVCCVTAALGVTAYYSQINSSAERVARLNADKVVELLNHELEAYFQGQSAQVAVQAVMPDVQRYFSGSIADAEMTRLLNAVCRSNGASLCYLLDKQGVFVASNDFSKKSITMGNSYAFRPYFKEAISGGSAIYLTKGNTTKKRGIYFSHIVRNKAGQFSGMVVNKFAVEDFEARFKKLPGQMVLMDTDGVVFASNIKEWIFNSLLPLDAMQQDAIANSLQFGEEAPGLIPFRWLSSESAEDQFGNRYWVTSEPVNRLPGWRLTYLNSSESMTSQALHSNSLLGTVILLGLLVLGTVIFLYRQGSYNIAKRHGVEAKLRQSEARLLQLSQVSTEAIVMHRDETILDFNEIAERLFGYTREELLQLSMADIYAPDKLKKTRQQLADGSTCIESEAVRRDGVSFPVEVNVKHTQIDGQDQWMSAIRDITLRKQQEKRMHYQAQFDALTNLPNRKLMRERLERAITRARLKGTLVVLMFIDLDDFKKINDTLGHEVGDQLLVSVSGRLQDAVREGDTLARYGGDEFILMLEDQEGLYDAEIVARKMLAVLGMEFRLLGRSFFISGSIGISVAPGDGIAPDELLKKADTAMYRVKDEGRNNFCFYTPDMNTEITNRLEIEHQLRGALSRNELHLHYQPIYCLKRNVLMGAEVLVRWDNEALGTITPDQFIPVAEQTGLIIPIGEWILRQACMQAKQWMTLLNPGFRLGVNVSPRQFKDGHIVHMLLRVLEETGFPASQLIVEITEGVLIRNDESTAQTLAQIKAMGIGLSMDDFGTGYSSLSYLKQFPFDTIKIDRSFVSDLVDDPGDRQLIKASVAMAKGLGLKVVAEGVEAGEQLGFLQQAGCDAVQGYYLGRPVSAMEFTEKTLSRSELTELIS
ncbi:bifunctional diguanylate cyclase/phosphodiesterase [Amphritea sp. HPY]|uniref:bifunctional diguanylate cyclase/phosphodiesterase n=1 Tax=Amphritea sp. HPY TaxID=3421652 RepID=UPI003D7E1C69